jgi:hypothetical protein
MMVCFYRFEATMPARDGPAVDTERIVEKPRYNGTG